MKKPKEILAQFKLLPVTEQSDFLNSLRVEFEGKGKLLELESGYFKFNFLIFLNACFSIAAISSKISADCS